MAIPWQKLLPLILQILTLVFGGTAIANATAVSYGAPDADTSMASLLTWGGGLSAIVTTIWGQYTTWRNAAGVSPSRAAEIASLGVLTACSSAKGDRLGLEMLGELSEHLDALESGKKTPKNAASDEEDTDDVKTLMQKLEARIRLDVANDVKTRKSIS